MIGKIWSAVYPIPFLATPATGLGMLRRGTREGVPIRMPTMFMMLRFVLLLHAPIIAELQ